MASIQTLNNYCFGTEYHWAAKKHLRVGGFTDFSDRLTTNNSWPEYGGLTGGAGKMLIVFVIETF